MARIKIRKVDGRWTSTVPGIGFNGQPRTQLHASHAEALAAHARTGATSGGSVSLAELAYTPVDQAHHVHHRPVCW